ncbi:MAG: AAA family ATPase [Clostridia bacterium]
MRLNRIKFNNHNLLKDLDLSFADENGKALDTVILIGRNGSGKTTILKNIFLRFTNNYNSQTECYLNVTQEEQAYLTSSSLLKPKIGNSKIPDKNLHFNIVENNIENLDKLTVVYMPSDTEMGNPLKVSNDFLTLVDQKITSTIPKIIDKKIDDEIRKDIYKSPLENVKNFIDKINSLFACLDLDVELMAVETFEKKEPVFKNKSGSEFNIQSLSSGEKQLFSRALSLKLLDINNSIILIDEPELSLHPKWQQKIVQVYENIGENNQLIIATHSPLILNSVKKEQIKILTRDENGIKILDDFDETFGHTAEDILTEIMDLKTVRNDEIELKLNKLNQLLSEEKYQSIEFEDLYKELRGFLGNTDIDLNLIDMDRNRRLRKRGE